MCMNYLNLSRAWSWSIYMFCISCPSTNQLLVITQEYKRVEFHSIHLFCNKVLNRIKPVHVTAQQARYRSLLNMSFFDRKYWSVWSITWRQGVTNLGGPILANNLCRSASPPDQVNNALVILAYNNHSARGQHRVNWQEVHCVFTLRDPELNSTSEQICNRVRNLQRKNPNLLI
jgi:hypothetical protein